MAAAVPGALRPQDLQRDYCMLLECGSQRTASDNRCATAFVAALASRAVHGQRCLRELSEGYRRGGEGGVPLLCPTHILTETLLMMPYIRFRRPLFNELLRRLSKLIIRLTKAADKVSAVDSGSSLMGLSSSSVASDNN